MKQYQKDIAEVAKCTTGIFAVSIYKLQHSKKLATKILTEQIIKA